MDFPKLDLNRPESLILSCVFLISAIVVYIRENTVSEYLYFYLCTISFLLLILAVISFAVSIVNMYTNSIPRHFLIFISIYTISTGVYWYLGLSLFEYAKMYFISMCLFFIILTLIGFVMIELGIFISTYHGDSKFISRLREIQHSITGPPDRYRSLTCWNLEEEEIQSLKIILGPLFLISLSLSVIYLPSILSSLSPRFYDIYTIDGNIKAEMNDEYSAGRNFYVPVEVEGLNTGLSVTLSKYEYDYEIFKEISSLTLKPNESMIRENDILSGEISSYGEYMIIVNTTSITTGDYELEFNNLQNVSSSKVFSLMPK